MPSLTDLLNEAGISNKDAIQFIGDAATTISALAGGIGQAESVVNWIVTNLLGGGTSDPVKNAIDNLTSTVDRDFQELNAALAASDLSSRASILKDLLKDPVTIFGELAPSGTLSSQNLGQLSKDDRQTTIDNAIQTCAEAVNGLNYDPTLPDKNWNLVFSEVPYWTDKGVYTYFAQPDPAVEGSAAGWVDAGYLGLTQGKAVPSRSDGTGFNPGDLVFNYNYTLVRYLQALLIFLAVGASIDSDFVTHWRSVITGDSQQIGAVPALTTIHDKILKEGFSQFVPSSKYASGWFPGDLTGTMISESSSSDPAWGITPLPPDVWISGGYARFKPDGVNIEYGPVELFSGASRMADYVIMFSNSFPRDDYNNSDPCSKFNIRALWKQKELYVAVGLRTLWNLINSLNKLVGGPLMSRPNYADWSFRNELIPMSGIGQQSDGKFHLTDLARFLKHTPPDDTPSLDKASTTSLRVALSPNTTSRL